MPDHNVLSLLVGGNARLFPDEGTMHAAYVPRIPAHNAIALGLAQPYLANSDDITDALTQQHTA